MLATRKTIYTDYSLKTEQGMLKTDIAKQINPPAGASVFDYLKNQNDNSMFLSPVDENEVIRAVESCKKRKLN